MKFGPVPVGQAEGAVLAHSIQLAGRRLRKAHVLTAEDIAALKAAEVAEVVAAVLAPDDLGEDEAAARIAGGMLFRGIEARPPSTGRVNLHAREAGVFAVDAAMIDAINAVDPAVTIATLANFAVVEQGQMVATVKIIPFAATCDTVEAVTGLCGRGEIFAVHRFSPKRVGIVQTVLPGIKDSVLAKTVRITEARLARSQSRVVEELRTAHETDAVAAAIVKLAGNCDLVVVFGASAVCDFDDVIPTAIRAAGGAVVRTGMPVDPGNLLVLGRLGGKPVLGAPGCARSPKENGFDWVLDRLVAGLEVTAADIAGLGVGGLLMEIPTRPQPREAPAAPVEPKVEIVLLAAGRSSRMGGPNKLLALFEGKPLVRRSAERALAARSVGVTVVTGHQADRIATALSGLDVKMVHNPDFASGLSGSLKRGVASLPADVAGAMIVLADMPGVSTGDLDHLIGSFEKSGGAAVVRAVYDGKRGNPVILPRSLFHAVSLLEGDTGARHLVEAEGLNVVDVEIGEGAGIDVDTRDALESAGGVLQD